MVFRKICSKRIESGTVANIAKVKFSQHKYIHILGIFFTPILVDVVDSSEYWGTDDTYMNVSCNVTSFTIGVGWIIRDVILRLFRLKKLNILRVKRLKI